MRTFRVLVAAQLLCGLALAQEPDWLKKPTLDKPRSEAPPGSEAKPGEDYIPDGPNLLTNGDFERGKEKQPANWDRLDNLTLRWVEGGPSGKGKCLEVDTDVYLDEWKRNNEELARKGVGATQKTKTTGKKYDTVGGTHGVHLHSDAINIQRGASYMLSVAIKGPSLEGFYPKVFVKGYRRINGNLREVWRGPLHLYANKEKWLQFKWRQPKEIAKYGAQQVKVVLYCYWPPGKYWIDDVVLKKVDPRRPAGTGRPVELKPPAEQKDKGDKSDAKEKK